MARTMICTPYCFEFQSYITGHQVYKDIWTPILDEKLATNKGNNNPHDKLAVKVQSSLSKTDTIGIEKWCLL